VIFISTLVFNNSCTGPSEEYFRKVRIDNGKNIIGHYPISSDMSSKIACYKVSFDPTGRVARVDYLRTGTLAVDRYFEAASVVCTFSDSTESRVYLDEKGVAKNIGGNSYGVLYMLNEKDQRWKSINIDNNGQPTWDEEGVTQYLYALDPLGYRLSTKCLDAEGRAIVDNDGIAERKFELDANGFIIKVSYWNVDRTPTKDSEGIFHCEYVRDSMGRSLEVELYDESGVPALSTKYGYFKCMCEYSDYGNQEVWRYFGLDGNPINRIDCGSSVLKIRLSSDGSIIEDSFYNSNEELVSEPESKFAIKVWSIGLDGIEQFAKGYDTNRNLLTDNSSKTTTSFTIKVPPKKEPAWSEDDWRKSLADGEGVIYKTSTTQGALFISYLENGKCFFYGSGKESEVVVNGKTITTTNINNPLI